MTMELDTILCGDSLNMLKALPESSVHCCVTSPPYYGLRDYGMDAQIGQEATPEEYISRLTAVFREVRRVLRPDGTLWVNIADSYCGTGSKGDTRDPKYPQGRNGQSISLCQAVRGCKQKDMIGIPWMLAFALRADGWYLDAAREAMTDGDIEYAGKYSAPDYEAICDADCDLALESTMIYHTPKVKEQLERLGIPVLVERSSYESNPLGRMEWIKLYGVLTGKEEQAEALYDEQLDALAPILDRPSTGKTAAFFYITANGAANVRKSTDYVAKMLELAGGKYIFDDLTDDDARSTMNMQMESFYAGAKDADVLIYNSTIDGELQTLDELLAKSPLLADFKAVKNGNVWCTEQSLFQSAMGLGGMIQDFHAVFTGENTDDLHYLHQLT